MTRRKWMVSFSKAGSNWNCILDPFCTPFWLVTFLTTWQKNSVVAAFFLLVQQQIILPSAVAETDSVAASVGAVTFATQPGTCAAANPFVLTSLRLNFTRIQPTNRRQDNQPPLHGNQYRPTTTARHGRGAPNPRSCVFLSVMPCHALSAITRPIQKLKQNSMPETRPKY